MTRKVARDRGLFLRLGNMSVRLDPHQSVVDRSIRMMFALVPNVFEHPWKIAGTKADYAVAPLPFEGFAEFVRACPFDLSYPFVKMNFWRGGLPSLPTNQGRTVNRPLRIMAQRRPAMNGGPRLKRGVRR